MLMDAPRQLSLMDVPGPSEPPAAGPFGLAAGAEEAGDAPPQPRKISRKMNAAAVAKVDINVVLVKCQWLWEGETQPHCIDVFSPSSPQGSTKARATWLALRNHKFWGPFMKFKEAMLNKAARSDGLVMDVDVTDAATPNDLLWACESHVDPQTWGKQRLLCQSHQNHISLMTLFGGIYVLRFVSELYNWSTLLRSGSYFLQLLVAAHEHFRRSDSVTVESGLPSVDDQLYAQEVKSFLCSNSFAEKSTGKKHLREKLDSLFSYWNADFHLSGVIKHRCSGRGCCDGLHGQRRRRLEFEEVVQNTMLGAAPCVPEIGKWCQLFLALDWWCLVLVGHFLFI